MHETSVARSLVQLVSDELDARGLADARVRRVRVRLGRLGSVIPAALRSAFDVARRHTPLHDATLDAELVEPAVWCDRCGAERTLPAANVMRLRCPTCRERCPQLVAGQEMELAGFEVDEHEEVSGDHGR